MKSLLAVFALSLGLVYGADAEHHDSLYQRLGGEKSMHAVVDDFTGRIAADQHLHAWFEHIEKDAHKTAEFKQHVASYLCHAAGGPCEFHAAGHAGKPLSKELFATVEKHLEEALDHAKVHEAEKHELMKLADGLHDAIDGD